MRFPAAIWCLGACGGWALPGCSDYDIKIVEDAAAPSDTSSEPPPDCGAFEAPAVVPPGRDSECLREVVPGTFTPVVEWQWSTNPVHPGYHQIMATPAVGNLTDDNGDGFIDDDDIPDIVFAAFTGSGYTTNGTLVAISGDGSGTHWSLSSVEGYGIYGSAGVAIGDIDADGSPDVCTAAIGASVLCLEADGSFKWAAGSEPYYVGCPAIADMDADGMPEVVWGRQVFDSFGTLLMSGSSGVGGRYMSFPLDMDADGQLEVVAGNVVYRLDGSELWNDGGADGIPAAGDFDGDGQPEIVRTASNSLVLSDSDGTTLWSTPVPGTGGGAPTVADYDGDDQPEVGVAGLSYYTMFDTDGSVAWSRGTEDDSSSVTGSSVFDFEGDGAAEVVYADEHNLFVYDGTTGEVVLQVTDHASGTLFEYPLVADVDNDGSTEIVLASNNYAWAGWNGITVIGDKSSSWSAARPIWNQFAYHITNVNDDGSIPRVQTPNWLTWNNFRAGGTSIGPSDWLADLAPGEPEICTDACGSDSVTFYLPVTNSGLLDATTFDVVFLRVEGTAESLVSTQTVTSLRSGTGSVLGPFELTSAQWGSGRLLALVDDPDAVGECDEDDNLLDLGAWPCE